MPNFFLIILSFVSPIISIFASLGETLSNFFSFYFILYRYLNFIIEYSPFISSHEVSLNCCNSHLITILVLVSPSQSGMYYSLLDSVCQIGFEYYILWGEGFEGGGLLQTTLLGE